MLSVILILSLALGVKFACEVTICIEGGRELVASFFGFGVGNSGKIVAIFGFPYCFPCQVCGGLSENVISVILIFGSASVDITVVFFTKGKP